MASQTPDSSSGLDIQDRIYAGLRAVSLLAGLAFAFLSVGMDPIRARVLTSLGAFAGYSLLAYLVGHRLLRKGAKSAFYIGVAALDLAFTTALMILTGGAYSPFYRALYLWVAMLAFYFGRRGGLVASVLALGVYVGFHLQDRFAGDPWLLTVQAGGMLMHGPLIGYLTDRERQRAEALREARDGLADANQRLREEQAKLVQAEKLSSIGLLAAGVAHEINNPLHGVMGCVKALREGSVPADRREEYFETVREGLERIRITVQGLLDYARQRAPSPTELDAADLVSACLRLLGPVMRKKDLRVEMKIAPGQARILADRSQLMQAIVNILMNAAYAVPHRGELAVLAPREGGRVGIRVTDRGPGIPPEILSRVCDPFFTTKPEGEGTGLGLAVTLGIARAHGGDLAIESEAGRGTIVTIWLPDQGGASARA